MLEHNLKLCNITEFQITRADFALDSFDNNSYREYYKLNKLLHLLIQLKYRIVNNYKSENLIGSKLLTLRLQKDCFQVEYYNKSEQSRGRSPATARLELRSLKMDRKKHQDIRKIATEWIDILLSLPDYYQELQQKCNQELLKIWQYEKGGSKSQRTQLNNFLYEHRYAFFSSNQLKEFYESIGIKNAQQRAYEYKRRNPDFEFITKKYLVDYLNQIKNALLKYMGEQPISTSKIL